MDFVTEIYRKSKFFPAEKKYSWALQIRRRMLIGLVGTFLVSYTRARAEALGIDAKVGFMQRPERVVLLSAPQGFFGLAWNGWVLIGVVCILAVSAWTTAIHRVAYVRRATKTTGSATIRVINEKKKLSARFASRRARS